MNQSYPNIDHPNLNLNIDYLNPNLSINTDYFGTPIVQNLFKYQDYF